MRRFCLRIICIDGNRKLIFSDGAGCGRLIIHRRDYCDLWLDESISQLGGDIVVCVYFYFSKRRRGMVNASFIQCAGTDCINPILVADIVVMHVSVDLGFGIERTKIKQMIVICFKDERVIWSK